MKQSLAIFFSGFSVAFALQSLRQDYLGKSEYIQLIDSNWVNGWYTTPIALTCLIGSLFIFWFAHNQKEQLDD